MLPPLDETQYISLSKWLSELRAPYLASEGISSRTSRFTGSIPAIGSWRLDDFRGLYGREIALLVELNANRLVDSELDSAGRLLPDRRDDAVRYGEWIRKRHRPPPVEVVETDGHRRLVAARNADAMLLCWVSPAVNTPTRDLDSNGHVIKTGLTFEMWLQQGPVAFEGSAFCQSIGIEGRVCFSPGA